MRRKVLAACLLLAFAVGLGTSALAELPFDDDYAVYSAYVSALSGDGHALAEYETADKSFNHYDGVDNVTVSYTPVEGLQYSLDYEDDTLFMVYLSIAPDSPLLDDPFAVILPLMEQYDTAFEDTTSEEMFLTQLMETQQITDRGDKQYQLLLPNPDASEFYQSLHMMIYF